MILPDLQQLQQIVRSAAREELLPRFTRVERSHKADGSVITAADLTMQQRIQSTLRQQ
jgi:myo-inositol-1(or 4)-monophosphatase